MGGLKTIGTQMMTDWKKAAGAEGKQILSAYGK